MNNPDPTAAMKRAPEVAVPRRQFVGLLASAAVTWTLGARAMPVLVSPCGSPEPNGRATMRAEKLARLCSPKSGEEPR